MVNSCVAYNIRGLVPEYVRASAEYIRALSGRPNIFGVNWTLFFFTFEPEYIRAIVGASCHWHAQCTQLVPQLTGTLSGIWPLSCVCHAFLLFNLSWISRVLSINFDSYVSFSPPFDCGHFEYMINNAFLVICTLWTWSWSVNISKYPRLVV